MSPPRYPDGWGFRHVHPQPAAVSLLPWAAGQPCWPRRPADSRELQQVSAADSGAATGGCRLGCYCGALTTKALAMVGRMAQVAGLTAQVRPSSPFLALPLFALYAAAASCWLGCLHGGRVLVCRGRRAGQAEGAYVRRRRWLSTAGQAPDRQLQVVGWLPRCHEHTTNRCTAFDRQGNPCLMTCMAS